MIDWLTYCDRIARLRDRGLSLRVVKMLREAGDLSLLSEAEALTDEQLRQVNAAAALS